MSSTSTLTVSDVRLIPASAAESVAGLLGYVTLTLNGLLRLDGLALRRTLSGALALSFPARTDRAGRRHAYYRPLDDHTRRVIEAQVFAALRMQAQGAA